MWGVGLFLLILGEAALGNPSPSGQPCLLVQSAADNDTDLDLAPEIIEESPLLQRWLEEIPDVLEEIRQDPSFRTRFRLGYSQFLAGDDEGGFNVGVEDIFLGRTGLTISGDYQASFDGDRASGGGSLNYYLLPLGSYINIAPLLGYRYLEIDDFASDGVSVGAKLTLALSRTGAADIVFTQSFISPGGDEEVGISTLSLGYAFSSDWRLSTDLQQQNSKEEKDKRVGIALEWMP